MVTRVSLDFDRAFFYPLGDPRALSKLFLWGIFMCLPPFFFLSLGFFARGIEDTIQGKCDKLPEWSDWWTLFCKGFFTFLLLLVYLMPGILIVAPLPHLLEDYFLQQNLLEFPVIFLLLCLLLLYVVFVQFLIPLALLRFSLSGRLFDALKIGDFMVFVKKEKSLYVVAIMYMFLTTLVMQWGLIIVVGLILTVPYCFMVIAHIIGQLAPSIKNGAGQGTLGKGNHKS